MGKGCLFGICFKTVQCGAEESGWGYRLNEKIVEDGCMKLHCDVFFCGCLKFLQ